MLPYQEKVAAIYATISGGSFVTAHWFLIADKVVHFGASLVSVITGVVAAIFYIKGIFKKNGPTPPK